MTNFTIGKHKTRDGKDAVVLLDWREHGVKSGYPLEGYIVREDGIKYVDNWTPDGRNDIDHGSHHDDLMPPAPRRIEKEVFVIGFQEAESSIQHSTGLVWSIRQCEGYRKKVKIIIEEIIE